MPSTVGLVVDPQFGDRVEGLASRMHVWLIDSPANRQGAERVWSSADGGAIGRGVTTFGRAAGEFDREKACLDVLESLDLHHGEYSQVPPYSALEVVGVKSSAALRARLSEFGFRVFAETAEGFRARK